MALTVNEELRDSTISHAVDLEHYSNSVVRRIIGLLNRNDPDLFAQVVAALEKLPASQFTVDRLESLLYSVRALNLQAYQAVERELTDDMQHTVRYELGYQQQLFESVIPAQIIADVGVGALDANTVAAAALSRPFQSRLLAEWSKSIEADRMVRIRDAIRLGYVQGQTTSQIVQRIRGTRAKGYGDGIIEIDRRSAESVTKTALSHVSSYARDSFYNRNKDLLAAQQWLSVIDLRTSTPCRLRDGLQYTADESHRPIGHSVPWLSGPGRLHWCCRSTSTPVVKSAKALGGADIPGFSASTRASLDGQIAASTTYSDWLKRQSAARQDEVLGPTRGALLRKGGLELKDMYTSKGRYLTLDELRQQDAAAFKKAA